MNTGLKAKATGFLAVAVITVITAGMLQPAMAQPVRAEEGASGGAGVSYVDMYGAKLDELATIAVGMFSDGPDYQKYGLYDMTGDGIKELLVYHEGDYEGDIGYYVYTWDGTQVVQCQEKLLRGGQLRGSGTSVLELHGAPKTWSTIVMKWNLADNTLKGEIFGQASMDDASFPASFPDWANATPIEFSADMYDRSILEKESGGAAQPADEATSGQTENTACSTTSTLAEEDSFDETYFINRVKEASLFYQKWFMTHDYMVWNSVSETDTITGTISGSGQEWIYHAVQDDQIRSVDDLHRLAHTLYTDQAILDAEAIYRGMGIEPYIEQEGKLYISEPSGLGGGAAADEVMITAAKVDEETWNIDLYVRYDPYVPFGENTVTLKYVKERDDWCFDSTVYIPWIEGCDTVNCIVKNGAASQGEEDTGTEGRTYEENYALFEKYIRDCLAIDGSASIAFCDVTGDGRAELLAVYAEEQVAFSTVLNIIDYDMGSLGTVPCSYGAVDGYYNGSLIVSGGHMDDYFSQIVTWNGANLVVEDLNRVDTSQIMDFDEKERAREEGLLEGLDLTQYVPIERVQLYMVDGQIEYNNRELPE